MTQGLGCRVRPRMRPDFSTTEEDALKHVLRFRLTMQPRYLPSLTPSTIICGVSCILIKIFLCQELTPCIERLVHRHLRAGNYDLSVTTERSAGRAFSLSALKKERILGDELRRRVCQ